MSATVMVKIAGSEAPNSLAAVMLILAVPFLGGVPVRRSIPVLAVNPYWSSRLSHSGRPVSVSEKLEKGPSCGAKNFQPRQAEYRDALSGFVTQPASGRLAHSAAEDMDEMRHGTVTADARDIGNGASGFKQIGRAT